MTAVCQGHQCLERVAAAATLAHVMARPAGRVVVSVVPVALSRPPVTMQPDPVVGTAVVDADLARPLEEVGGSFPCRE
jgi:hypothetical protein